jgi:hypothetical protein
MSKTKPEKKPEAEAYAKFVPPQTMSYILKFDESRRLFFFHSIERRLAGEFQAFAAGMHGLQRALERSLLLASLWAGVALTIAMLLLVMIIGVR